MNYKMNAHLSDFNFQSACKKAISYYYPRTRLYSYAAIILFLSSYIATIYLNKISNSGQYNFLVFLGLAAPLAFVFHIFWRQRKIYSALKNGALRSDSTIITLDETGYHSEKTGHHMSISWEHFVDVIDAQEGLILLVGVAEFFLIPKNAFPDGITASELRTQIASWILAAKSA